MQPRSEEKRSDVEVGNGMVGVPLVDRATMSFREEFDIAGTAAFIRRQGYARVALQFPDELLRRSVAVSSALRAEIASQSESSHDLDGAGAVRLFVMADTTFGSCCADEIAAMHVDAQCVVHYGHSCFSRTSRLPVWYVFGRAIIDSDKCARRVIDFAEETRKPIMVVCGASYFHAWESVRDTVQGYQEKDLDIIFADCSPQLMEPIDMECERNCPAKASSSVSPEHSQTVQWRSGAHSTDGTSERQGVDDDKNLRSNQMSGAIAGDAASSGRDSHGGVGMKYGVSGSHWTLQEGRPLECYVILWIGNEDPGFTNLSLIFNSSTHPVVIAISRQVVAQLQRTFFKIYKIVRYDPSEDKILKGVASQSKFLQRRYFLVERAKDASVVGIVVGTLGVSGYRSAIQSIREMIEEAGKKSYTLVMGKPNPAKLANFPECEVFVLVSCPQTAILDSKEYLAPVITPFEAGLAFVEEQLWTGAYRLDIANMTLPVNRQSRGTSNAEPRFSFLKGGYVGVDQSEDAESQYSKMKSVTLSHASDNALRLQSESSRSIINTERSALEITSGAEYLASRTYQGLNINGEGPERSQRASAAVMGRTGRAAGYLDEANQ